MRQLRQPDASRIRDDEFRTPGDCLLKPRCCDRMTFRHICADTENHLRFLHINERVRHRATSDCRCQTGNGWRVSGTAAIVDVVSAEPDTDKLLHQVRRFTRCAPRSDTVDTVSTVFSIDFSETFSGSVKRVFPCGFVELAVVPTDKRCFQPISSVAQSRKQTDL